MSEPGDDGVTVTVEAEQDTVPGGDVLGSGHVHPFDTGKAILHHTMPYPAWEVFHGQPWILFDKGGYAAFHYQELRHDAHFAAQQPDEATLAWASQVKATEDFRWKITDVSEQDLAKAMMVAESHAGLVFPKALSWVNQQLFFGTIALLLLVIGVCGLWRRRPEQLKPAGRMQHFFESVTIYLRDEVVKPAFHHGAGSWTPFFVSIFFMILAVNLFGLIPGGGTMSGNIGVTSAWATIILFCMLFFGMKEQGPKYWTNLVPIHFTLAMSPVWLLLLVIELLGLIIKPAALAIRLFANMLAGHTVLLVFFSLGFILINADPMGSGIASSLGIFGWFLGLAFHAMELLVAFIQAYVFTLLAALFIGMSIHPEH